HKTVEVGHIFKLGYKYSESMGLRVLNEAGVEVAPIMGSYGIGIERILSAAVELYHDKDGMVLPASIAPFAVVVTPVNFNDEAFLDVPFTNDVKKLEEGVARIDSRGGTAMRDAISMSIDYLKEEGKLDKKVILVVTDGNDNTSSLSLEQLVQKAQQSEVLIYTIGLLNEEVPREAKQARRALNALTTASGGLAYYPKELLDVEQIALQVAHEVRNQYTIAYTPTNAALDGSFRHVRVTVKGPNRPIARTRTGYYATPDTPKMSFAESPSTQ
ncbi:MAG: VWA domain-containing protein, partial [Fimbriimonadales bacterium]